MSITAARRALQGAVIRAGQNLASETQAAIEDALLKTSAVEAVVGCFRALAPLAGDIDEETREALRAAALDLAAHNYHGLSVDAEMLLAQLPPPPAPAPLALPAQPEA